MCVYLWLVVCVLNLLCLRVCAFLYVCLRTRVFEPVSIFVCLYAWRLVALCMLFLYFRL